MADDRTVRAITLMSKTRRTQPVVNRANQDEYGIPIAQIHHLGRAQKDESGQWECRIGLT